MRRGPLGRPDAPRRQAFWRWDRPGSGVGGSSGGRPSPPNRRGAAARAKLRGAVGVLYNAAPFVILDRPTAASARRWNLKFATIFWWTGRGGCPPPSPAHPLLLPGYRRLWRGQLNRGEQVHPVAVGSDPVLRRGPGRRVGCGGITRSPGERMREKGKKSLERPLQAFDEWFVRGGAPPGRRR